LNTVSVTPEEVGFAGATQIGKLRSRVRGCGRKVKETRYLITSASNEQLGALGLLDAKRGYWAIEAGLHYRLDEVLKEDESRVRSGPAAHILGMCRRLAVSLACAWLQRAKGDKKHCRKSTRDFQDHLKAHGAACAFALVAASNPTAWLPN
jgi:predicted transposase YbfD/YdcC